MPTKKVALLSEMPPGTMKGVEIDGRHILLANVDGVIYGMDGLCSHMAARLWEGSLDGHVVKCPKHGSRYDVRTGEVVSQVRIPLIGKAKPLGIYKISIEGGDVLIDI
ncbi:MAG TPA: Rieske 2Fe-2S domain-containing protein [Methanomassiliicoccales archaeon]|nr:Rieske 2Fe-2S domain-containing protein [Methanomassiliicoccales archaeon]HPR97755.1 Rieske 2Fe-2S domain-containing protein [Methanomassiliicoccales archaeon]